MASVNTYTFSCSRAGVTDDQYAHVHLTGKQTEVAIDGKSPGNPCHLRGIFLVLACIRSVFFGNSMRQSGEFFCELSIHG